MLRLFVAVLAAMLAMPTAHASDGDARAASEELIARGVDARLHEHHDEALELFRKAHALWPSARTLAQMGLAEISLHRWLDAEDHLATALQRHDVPWVEDLRVRDVLEKSLEKARAHIGTLVIVGMPGTEILVDGRSVGTLPLAKPLRLAAGKARVAGSATGRRAAEVEVEVVGGAETTTRLDLPPIPLAAPPPPAPPAQVEVPRPVAPTPAPAPAEPGPLPHWQTWAGAGLLVLSAGATITGAILLKIDGRGTCSSPPGVECPKLWDTKKVGVVSFIGAAVGTAAGITLIAWHPDTVARSASLVPAGIAVAASF
jgi:hypothetical protein